MTIVCLGDRGAGKTHLLLELANPNYRNVRVIYPDYYQLKLLLYDDKSKSTLATDASIPLHEINVKVEVTLPARVKNINLNIFDNSGEVWRKYWQEENPDKWQSFLEEIQKFSAVILMLEPYRETISDEKEKEKFITLRQWVNRFNRWTDFLISYGKNFKHIIICLSKADLLINHKSHLQFFNYDAKKSGKAIATVDEYTVKTYLYPIASQISLINNSLNRCLPIKAFLTSIYQRESIELPFVYLASYLE